MRFVCTINFVNAVMFLMRFSANANARSQKSHKARTLYLRVCTVVKSKMKISQNLVAFLEYMNFRRLFGVLVQIQLSQKQTGLQKNTHCWDSRILK